MKRTKDASDALTDGLRIYLDDLEGEEEEGEEEEEMEVEGGQQQLTATHDSSLRVACFACSTVFGVPHYTGMDTVVECPSCSTANMLPERWVCDGCGKELKKQGAYTMHKRFCKVEPQKPSSESQQGLMQLQVAPKPPPKPSHLFTEYPEKTVACTHQHNGHDCGLYMLKHVELLATHQIALGEPRGIGRRHSRESASLSFASGQPQARELRWRDHPELAFSSEDIDASRRRMRLTIGHLGEAQQAERIAQERSSRSKPRKGSHE